MTMIRTQVKRFSFSRVLSSFISKNGARISLEMIVPMPRDWPPLALMLVLFYIGPRYGLFRAYESSALLICMLVLSISHTGYIPLRIRDRYTARNYFVCAIDLFCSLLKWSTVAGFIMARDIIRSASNIVSRTYNSDSYVIAFAILFGILLLLQFIKWLIARGGKEDFQE